MINLVKFQFSDFSGDLLTYFRKHFLRIRQHNLKAGFVLHRVDTGQPGSLQLPTGHRKERT
jgi:hypothetical protein